ncbi:F-box domain-containing protein [Mycena indigotica]|uniref:F-box domain-containing protein n=1 Tax=Mycena indigotica TaxID=2126181 RepID=A0A8H6SIR4_9AGAR|nr:F-box domain-containing protein [Mycena indigotica]KAF7299520.1 F-box domain-containing protein [Mycena indigotica]
MLTSDASDQEEMSENDLRQLLSEGLEDEALLTHEIESTLALLHDLHDLLGQKKQENTAIAAALAALRSPIQRLPGELLEAIFELCVVADSTALTYFTSDSRVAPLVLTHVCAAWRQLTFGSLRLWKHWYFRATHTRSDLELLTRVIPSGHLQLHTTIVHTVQGPNSRVSRRRHKGIPVFVIQALLSIPQFVAGVPTLVLAKGALSPTEELARPPQTFKELRALTIDLHRSPPFHPDAGQTLDAFADAPRLTNLDLTLSLGEAPPGSLFAPHFPWAQIRSLRLAFPGNALPMDWRDRGALRSILHILSRCTNVKELTLYGLSPPLFMAMVDQPPLCVLPLLTKLVLLFTETLVVQFLVLPRLQELVLSSPKSRGDLFPLERFRRNSEASLTTLRTLEVRGLTSLGLHVLRTTFMSPASPITTLRLPDIQDTNAINALVSWQDADRPLLLPALTFIFIGAHNASVVQDGGISILKMIRSRLGPQTGDTSGKIAASASATLLRAEVALPESVWPRTVEVWDAKWELIACGVLHLSGSMS